MPAPRVVRYALATVCVGVVGALFAVGFRAAMHWVFKTFAGHSDVLSTFRGMSWYSRIVLPMLGGVVAGVIAVVASRRANAKGHGVAEILEAVALGRGRVSALSATWKALGSFVAMVTGGSVGREGPIVQFGAGVGNTLGQVFNLPPAQGRVLVAAGTAAGFTAAYNTPLAALLFVIEIVAGVLSFEFLLPVTMAVCVSTLLSRMIEGNHQIYNLPHVHFSGILAYTVTVVIGVIAGFFGVGFLALLDLGERIFKKITIPRPLKGGLGGLIVGLLASRLPEVTGNGQDAIHWFLHHSTVWWLLLLFGASKLLATTASVTSGSPGGIFTPALFVGAILGQATEQIFHSIVPSFMATGYSLLGMAALASATTHAPLMSTVLVLELSGQYSIVVPILIATTIAGFVSRKIRTGSVYTEELRRRGIPWDAPLNQRRALAIRAKEIYEQDPCCLSPDSRVSVARECFAKGESRVIFVCDGAVRAVIARSLMGEGVKSDDPVGKYAKPVPTVTEETTFAEILEKLWKTMAGEIPVVAAHNQAKVIGVVTWRGVLGALDREILERDVLMTRVVWLEGQHEAADYLELPKDHRVEVIAAPKHTHGLVLDPANLRRDHQVTVLSVRRIQEGNVTIEWMTLEQADKTREGDLWLVVGTASNIEKIKDINPAIH